LKIGQHLPKFCLRLEWRVVLTDSVGLHLRDDVDIVEQ